jgi:Rrf2 family transcriptional regulator, iron-sulfur cluster assembly transcription factor
MRLTTKGRYGVRAVVNLAAAPNNEPISISQIAKKEQLSPEFLEQIFFRLKKAGLIRSIRGPKGGFVLNHKPSEITVKTILDAVGESLFPAPCVDHGTAVCARQKGCPISPLWQDFYELIRKHLSSVSLKDILDNAEIPAGSSPAR